LERSDFGIPFAVWAKSPVRSLFQSLASPHFRKGSLKIDEFKAG